VELGNVAPLAPEHQRAHLLAKDLAAQHLDAQYFQVAVGAMLL
jgi:hypothetical protein